jgi:hypothetical protein
VADEIVDGKVLDGQQGVVLDQLARDLMEEAAAGVGNPGVLTPKPPAGFCVVPGAALRSRQGAGTALQSAKPGGQGMVGLPATDLGSVRSCGNRERDKPYVDSDIAATLSFGTRLVAAPWMNVGCMDVETDIPAGTSPSDGGKENLGSWSDPLLPGGWVDLGPGPEKAAKPSGVVMHPDPTQGGQGDRPERSVPHTDQVSTRLALVPQAETVAAATFALAPREAEPAAATCILLRPAIGSQGTTEIDRGLLEYLG